MGENQASLLSATIMTNQTSMKSMTFLRRDRPFLAGIHLLGYKTAAWAKPVHHGTTFSINQF